MIGFLFAAAACATTRAVADAVDSKPSEPVRTWEPATRIPASDWSQTPVPDWYKPAPLPPEQPVPKKHVTTASEFIGGLIFIAIVYIWYFLALP